MTYKKQIPRKLYFFVGVFILLMIGIFSCTYRKASIVSPNQESYDNEMKPVFAQNCVCHVSRGQIPSFSSLAGIEANKQKIIDVINQTGPVTFTGVNGTRSMGAIVSADVQAQIKTWIENLK